MAIDWNWLEDAISIIEETLLPDTCDILYVIQPTSQFGGTATYGTIQTDMACRFDSVNMNSVNKTDQQLPTHDYIVTLPYDTSVDESYILKKGSDYYGIVGEDGDKSKKACVRLKVKRQTNVG